MRKQNNKMDVVFILDKSGSMYGSEADTIGGYNSYIEENINENSSVTTVLFDNQIKYLSENVDIKDVRKLTLEDYRVGGCTALYDAIGEVITKLDKKKSKKALIIITTDGYENASIKYTSHLIKEMIKEHENYKFLYVGADIDSYAEGSKIGISEDCIANYEKTSDGIGKVFKAVSKASRSYACADYIETNWKEELEK